MLIAHSCFYHVSIGNGLQLVNITAFKAPHNLKVFSIALVLLWCQQLGSGQG